MSGWQQVCELERVPAGAGVCALVDGEQVAVFRTAAGALHAVSNHDPFSGAMVISRGIVGTRGDRATVASPMHKQVFDLASGTCLDDPSVALAVHGVRLHGQSIEVQMQVQVQVRQQAG
jgi:nitrite reductase (NADH) small subunit